MVANFRARGISRGACKLAQTPTLIKKKKMSLVYLLSPFKYLLSALPLVRN